MIRADDENGRSIHNGRRDHCVCEWCWGEGFRTFATGTLTCMGCYGTGKGYCRHRDDDPSNKTDERARPWLR